MSKQIKLVTPVAIASFPHLFQPESFEGQDPKYSIMLAFTPDTDLTPLKKAAAAAAKERFGDKAAAVLKRNPVFRDHDAELEEGKSDKGFPKGSVFINARSKNPPVVVSRTKSGGMPRMISEEEGTSRGEYEIYGGCLVKAQVSVYAYDTAGNQGIGFGLNGVQKWADGDRLDGAASAANMFEYDEPEELDLDDVMGDDDEGEGDDLTDLL